MAETKPAQLQLVNSTITTGESVLDYRGHVGQIDDPAAVSSDRNNGHSEGNPVHPSYAPSMGTTARDIAAALREQLPGLNRTRLHKLLYYCAGHHLAMQGRPLFDERVAAWDDGPVVLGLRNDDQAEADIRRLTESELNTIGYVVSRYGKLTGNDLKNLTRAETPWKTANAHRPAGATATIEHEWMRAYFGGEGAPLAGNGGPVFDSSDIAKMLAGAEERYRERRKTLAAEPAEEAQPVVGRRGA